MDAGKFTTPNLIKIKKAILSVRERWVTQDIREGFRGEVAFEQSLVEGGGLYRWEGGVELHLGGGAGSTAHRADGGTLERAEVGWHGGWGWADVVEGMRTWLWMPSCSAGNGPARDLCEACHDLTDSKCWLTAVSGRIGGIADKAWPVRAGKQGE